MRRWEKAPAEKGALLATQEKKVSKYVKGRAEGRDCAIDKRYSKIHFKNSL